METVDYRNIAQAIQGLLTSLAIVVGGFWTYFIFIKNRSNYPIVDLDLSYDQFEIENNKRLIHVSLKIKNNGLVLLQSKEAELRLRQVTPLPNDVLDDLDKGHDPVQKDTQEILWPLEAERNWTWTDQSFEIEPNESDALHADFIIDRSIEIIQFYFYLKNNSKSNRQVGWTLTTLKKLHTEGNDDDR